jgi:hypothetical protein
MNSLREALLISILMVAFFSANGMAGSPLNAKNESTIVYKNELKQTRNVCSGSLNDVTILNKIGLTEADLRKGVDCVVGDFDGNGYLDFALYGRIIHEPPVIDHPEALGVISFQGSNILKTQVLKDQHFSAPELYPTKTKKGPFGEPASKTVGIVEWGEGGATVICLYNSVRVEMTCSYYPSENE